MNFSLPTPNSELFPPLRKDSTQGGERGRLVCTPDWHRPSHPGVCTGKGAAPETQADTVRADTSMFPVLPRTTDGFAMEHDMDVRVVP